jgi:hypothetical protein
MLKEWTTIERARA